MSNYYHVDAVDFYYESMDLRMRGGFAVKLRVTPRFCLLMICATIVAFSVSFGVLQYRYVQGTRQLESINAHRNDLVLQARDLTDALAYAQTDAYVIRTARDQLGLIMPGEIRYVNGAH